MTDDHDDLEPGNHHGSLAREQRMQRAHEKHKALQLSEQAYTVLMPVRANLFSVVKAFQYEAKRNGTMPFFANTLRTMLLWAEVNMGRSDDDILDSIEAELDRIHDKQRSYKGASHDEG